MKRYFLVANGLEIMFQRVWYHLKKRMEDSNFATFCAKMKQNRQLIWATISPRGRTQVNWLLLWHTENSFSFGKRSRNCMEEKINNSLSCFLFQLFFSTFSSSTASSSWPNKTRQNYRVLVSLIWKKKDWHAMCLLSRHIQGKIPIFKRPFTMDFQYKEGH